jgi:UDP-2,3-diacylglucosamine pyrophosphatase LpxH
MKTYFIDDPFFGMKSRTHYRAVFPSDFHLGFQGARAKALSNFLDSVTCDYLYLVGDIFDFWEMLKRVSWNLDCFAVIRRVLKLVSRGTVVKYCPGNHDDAIRHLLPLRFGTEIEIADYFIHTTAAGARLMVVHGDRFDSIVKHAKWLAKFGNTLYDWLLLSNGLLHQVRMALGYQSYWSFAGYLKSQAKVVGGFINDFGTAAIKFARDNGCVGVVCGHIHKAALHQVEGLTYANCGDWVESLTALVETNTGELKLVYWSCVGSA